MPCAGLNSHWIFPAVMVIFMLAIIIGIMACMGMPLMLPGMDIGIFIIDCMVI